jgi:hypothetical protein
MKNRIGTSLKLLVGASALMLATGTAFAATIEWANVGTDWTTGANWSGGTAPTVVPEPATMAMMALGAGLLVGVQRFRRKLR